ncbi:extracellular matrix protein FRAS1 isoform X2 [Gadus macrocephalus]|uniref:extracellular matrix protein FRAS1 isoform X2 n=1 Tax=Gadus macrocephalus TaxID=80720 RepID=UPI0028CB674E|nr:extracellular matrix protein FRAS1 isoform X2 [Gadus macrocephalus]
MALWWLVVAAVVCGSPGAYGACVHHGSLYMTATSWRGPACESCTCYGDITVCLPPRCPNPRCDYHKGERLRIPADGCCPECVSTSQDLCQHQGLTYGDNSQWSPSPCEECVCSGGSVSCSPLPCPPLLCPPHQTLRTLAGQCCPICVRTGASCSVQGELFSHGDVWSSTPCSRCVCQDGDIACSAAECQPVTCQPEQNLVIPAGGCCPRCVSNPCLSGGEQHQHGEQWQKDSCTTCVCDRGQSRCHTHTCPDITCPKGESKAQRAGQCCEECVATRGSCLYDGTLRYHGDMWNGTGCEYCSCERGQVVCRNAECGRLTCQQGQEVVRLQGKCCPHCVSMTTSCVFQNRPHQNGARWTEGACRECECEDGQVTCYLRTCPICPSGSLALPQDGHCCPQCTNVQCQSDCASCSGSADLCLTCRDSNSLVHLGRCLTVCPHGYRPDGHTCTACQPSCASCSREWGCDSCAASLLLTADRGRCVPSCPPGSYQHLHTHCSDCHPSCSECFSAGQQDCLVCSDPAALLKDGECVADCGAGYYSQQGVCSACDPSCSSCYPDNPACLSCPPSTALHHGRCITQCPDHHYLDNHGRCRGCHSSCASCWGPSGGQCSVCLEPLLLHQGHCVDSCGEGLYHKDNTCHNCHPSCRSCQGPQGSDCLRCLRPEDVLLPVDPQLPHGTCSHGCPAHFYLDTLHTCRGCHASCLHCTTGSADDCTSCLPPALLHFGHCVSTCPPGAFPLENTCAVCHATCDVCSGESLADCLSCPLLASLQQGSCRTSCPDSTYLHPSGECRRCSEGCQRCVWDHHSGVGSVCLRCGAPDDLLLGDHCVSRCPRGLYPWHGACRRCHSSCEGCRGPDPKSCTSCPAGHFLMTSGVCASACPVGYYDNGHRVCQACDHQCGSCSDPGVCLSCRDPAKVLLFGECQYERCAHQYYLNTTTRTCTECEWRCNMCVGPQPTDCLQCMEGFVLQHDVCTPKCTPGSFQRGERCFGCDAHCAECRGPAACLRCQPPYALLAGQCVLDCGRSHFLDASSQVCRPCSSDCVVCEDVGHCKTCGDQTFLIGGYCTADCGHGYYGNKKTRSCQGDLHPPTLSVNGSLLVPLGGSGPLGVGLLVVRDPDSPPDALFLQLILAPAAGKLLLLGGGRGGEGRRELLQGGSFTLNQLHNGQVVYEHTQDQPRRDQFTLRVADPQLLSQMETVAVQVVSTQPPKVLFLAPLLVDAPGAMATITKAVLHLEDPDNAAEVLLVVLEPPQHGRIAHLHGNRELGRFGLDQLSRGQVVYLHDGSPTYKDLFMLQVNDRHHYLNVPIQVLISHRTLSPKIRSIPVSWVKEGGMVQLSRKHLKAVLQGTAPDDIIYSIMPLDGQPEHGEVVLIPMPADAPAYSSSSSSSSSSFTSTSIFTQQDVNDGAVWYRHFGDGTQRDAFHFQVSTEGSPDLQGDPQVFSIGVLSQGPGVPQLDPDCQLQLTALEDQVTEITSSALSFIDSESPSHKLIYNITTPLMPGQGAIEHRDVPYQAVRFFSQADVDDGKILYRPPSAPAHLQELYQYSFTGLPESLNIYFSVSDGEYTTGVLDFSILLLSNHQQPPVFQVLRPQLEVSPEGRASLGGQQLAVADADTSPDDLEFEVVKTPLNGRLLHSDIPMKTGEVFSFSDVTRNSLQYQHTVLSKQEDAITFSVSDGISMATTVVQVVILEAGADGPRKDPGSILSLEVGEKSSTVLRRSHLAYTDNSSPDQQIRIQLVSVPMYGLLTRGLSPQDQQELAEYSTFTMEDINKQHIRYITSLETGSQPVTDIFHFVVYDGDNNRLDKQMCTITITSTIRTTPKVTVRGGIKVEKGGRVQLSTNQIIVSDLNTSRKELLLWLVTPPKYGFIERKSHTEGGAEGSRVITPDQPFSLEDLASDLIFYVQEAGGDSQQDLFSLYVSDGHRQTEAFNVEIHIQSSQAIAPVVSVSSVVVEENSGVVLTNTSLSVLDLDTPLNEIMITLDTKPAHGKLRRRQFYSQPLSSGRVLSVGSSFSYQDVLDMLVVYTPDGGGASDRLEFTLTDGVHTHSGALDFTVTARHREGPRMTVNRGLQLAAGSASKITEQNLKGSDIDSDPLKLSYILTSDPAAGTLLLNKKKLSAKGPTHSFTQEDVNKGRLQFSHSREEKGGSLSFKFNLVDPEGNKLIDQSFFISVLVDRLPPVVEVNKGLVVDENSRKKLTTLQLSASDQDSEPSELLFTVTKQLDLGHLEHVTNPGSSISSFSQADLVSRSVQYVHTSEEEKHSDQFTFSVSDGQNEVAQTFFITIRPVDDSLPWLQVPGMRVQEGVRKTITEFELKATDADTEAESIVFTVVQPPRHGSIERTASGQVYRRTSSFSMEDVFQNRISYNHDGSNSLKDRFSFTVSDGTNLLFMVEEGGKEVVTAAPQKFKVDILPVDDGTPRIVTNLGLQWLEYMDNKATNLITKKTLLTLDPDTEDGQLVYEVTTGPKHGFLENKLKPGNPITSFTQADVNLGLVRYVMHQENLQETSDNFKFLVKDSKPNEVRDNVFHIQWSLISFQHKSYNVSEKANTVSVTVKRSGNLNQYAIVLCRTEPGSATSSSSLGQRPGQLDYVEYAGQVQFDEREDTKVCTIIINDDQVFEGVESFHVELSMPVYALLGADMRAVVNINDTEDEPMLQFDKKTYHVNESAGLVHIPVERKGDLSSTVSALCHTVSRTAQGSSLHSLGSGSDYKSRGKGGDQRVVLGPGVSMTSCDLQLVDDSEYELSEEFQLVLSDPSDNARMGDITVAKVVIDGPNDASTVTLGNATFTFSEDIGTIEIPVIRHGSDLTTVTSVWCATRLTDPPSATPGLDYIPSSKKVEFKPGTTQETCSLTIMDDLQSPTIEGPESFVVFLSSPQGAVLLEPYEADVVITDTFQDIPSMQFEKSAYKVKEKEGVLHVRVLRTGDLSSVSSVRCFTRMLSALVMDDFTERRNADESRITFLKGEKVKNCTVRVSDDSVFEPEEDFQLHLGSPISEHWSTAMVGARDLATVTITNEEDAPTIEFQQVSYQVREPPGPDGVEVLSVKVHRHGDLDRTSKIRCSTRDGSAQSGLDYNPKSRVLKFTPGMDHILFKVEILSNEDREWHESFSLVLGPDDPVEAVLGEITMATVTILDQEAAGSLILPAPPLVVSLLDYNQVEEVTVEGSKKAPSAGYPLVCVTPCDPHYPKYSVTRGRCEEAGINQTQVHFSWEVATPTHSSGARSPFETVTDSTPYTGVNHKVLDSIYFSRRFHVRCVAQARDKAGHLGTPLRSNIATIGTEGAICHTPVTTGTARGFQAQSFIASLKYLDVKHKEHPNRIHISVQIPHQDGMLPLISTLPLHNLHLLLSESIYRQQHVCSNLLTLTELQGLSEASFLEEVSYDSISLGPGYDRPYQFNPQVRESRTIQLYRHLNLKSCIWNFDAFYDMTALIDVCGGSVTADFQVRDSAQSFLTVQVPLYVSYIYVTAPRGWASLEHHTEMEFSFFYDTILWRTGIQTDSVLSARLQIIRIFIREDGRLVIEFKTHAKFRGQFVPDHHTLPGHKSQLVAPDHLGGIKFDLQLVWSGQTFDSPYQLWRATSSYSRKDYSGEYTVLLVPCTVQPTQPWIDPADKPLSCTAHAPEKFLVPISFQQTNRPVPLVYSLNTEFQLCNNDKLFLLDPAAADISLAEMDYKGAFSMGQTLYGRVLWNPEQSLNAAYRLQLEKVYLCTGRDGYVPFFDPTGTLYNEGPQYGCLQPSKSLKHRFLLLDRKQPDVCDSYFHDVPFEANFASDLPELHPMAAMPGVDGFTMKVDALYKVEAGHQWYLQVIYVISPESRSGVRLQRSLLGVALPALPAARHRRDLVDSSGRLTLDESLIYDNEGDQVKNGTNMKSLRLQATPAPAYNAYLGSSVGGGVAAVSLLVLILLASCLLVQRCRAGGGKGSREEYPLNTKVEVCLDKRLEKNFSSRHCTVRNFNDLHGNHDTRTAKVNNKTKQVNLGVKLHNNLGDGTEV